MTGLPLDDVRVLDLTVARAGPTCVRQLADWGADVVRVEAPPRPGREGLVAERDSPDFQNLHRNKRAVCLDLKSDDGRRVFHRLVAGVDVVVENMRPPVKHRLGVDYGTLAALNPRLVYGSISGFGQDGPYASRGGVDQIAQGLGGLMSVTGLPGQGPVRVGVPIADLAAGLYLAVGVMVALHERERTGHGRWVRTSLLEAMVAMLDFQAARWTVAGEVAAQEGNHHPTSIPMGCFPTADGHVNIAGPSGRLWQRFCAVIGAPELLSDERYASGALRSRNRAELNAAVEARLRTRTTEEWVEALNEAGVPAGPVNTIDQVFADPQVEHLGLTATVHHPRLGDLRIVPQAVTMTGWPGDAGSDAGSEAAQEPPDARSAAVPAGRPPIRRPSPDPGQHTDEVLSAAGFPPEEIARLRAGGVIA